MNYGVELPKIIDGDVFELLCCELISMDNKYENVNRNGTRGQRQDGIDIFARTKGSKEWHGIQCKVKEKKIYIRDIQEEIIKAFNSPHKITKYIFYTTAKRDVKVQDFIREKSIEHINNGMFDIDIKFWEDISEEIKSEKNKAIHYKYYKNYYTQIKNDGFTFGKLVTLNIGELGTKDTFYPVLIGKTFSEDDIDEGRIEYWKNVYYIVNFHEKTMETFPIPCYPSDLEAAFSNSRDRYIISKILNSIRNMEKFLESDEKTMDYVLNRLELDDFLSMFPED